MIFINNHEYTFEDFVRLADERKEFCMKREAVDGQLFYSFFYNVAFADTFDTELAREFRGIVFDSEGNCVARPFHKFFNIGERPETQLSSIVNAQDHYWYDTKWDGSLVYPVLVNDKIKLRTKKSFYSEVAEKAQSRLTDWETDYMREAIKKGYTPLYEFVAPDNRIVIQYEDTYFKRLCDRCNTTGTYGNYGGYNLMYDEIEDFVHDVRDEEGIEGYVISRMSNCGEYMEMYKVKTKFYLDRHRAKDKILFKNVFESVVDQTFDDVLAFYVEMNMNDEHKEFVGKVKKIQQDFNQFICMIEVEYKKYADIVEQKDFAIAVELHPFKRFLFLKRADRDLTELTFKYMRQHYKDMGIWLT